MKPWRKAVVSAIVVGFTATHLVVMATGHSHWPVVASAGMWATKLERTFDCLVTYAVPADPASPEFPLSRRSVVSSLWLAFAYGKLLSYPERSAGYRGALADCPAGAPPARRACASKRLVEQVLAYLLDGYARKAAASPQPGDYPPVRGLRLYHVRYRQLPAGDYVVESRDLRGAWLAP